MAAAADAVSPHSPKPKNLVPEIPTLSPPPSDNTNPTKYFRQFLYKAALITIFLVLLPLFPSLAPEFINQTLHARSWELLQIIFVGIAVSYGLFSKKNDETDKDTHYTSKLDNAQSYVSKLLQVSSVFDDESDNQTVIDENVNKVQTWNSQYYRGEPVFVVAKEGATAEEGNDDVSEVGQKPLLLPVRSLKLQQPSESGRIRAAGNSAFRRNSRKLRNVDVGVVSEDDGMEDNVVLRSPIPWRSRSGRMEIMEENMEEQNKVESRSFKPTRLNSPVPSNPQKLSPFLLELDVVRKKGFSSPPPAPPPPPPPPPPQFIRKPVLAKSNSTMMNNVAAGDKTLRRSVRSVPMEELDDQPMRRRPESSSQLRRSVRTFRPSEMNNYETKFADKKGFPDRRSMNELVDKVVVDVDVDSSSDDDSEIKFAGGGGSSNGEGEAEADNSANELGPDVDKKADEFIAKFREQIRLQRIESIRRSTAQRTTRTSR